MKKIILGKKLIDLDKCQRIYSDGAFSSRGVDVYCTKKKTLIAVPWSRWQGEDPRPYILEVKDFLEFRHDYRVLKALEVAGIELAESDI